MNKIKQEIEERHITSKTFWQLLKTEIKPMIKYADENKFIKVFEIFYSKHNDYFVTKRRYNISVENNKKLTKKNIKLREELKGYRKIMKDLRFKGGK